VSHEGGLQAAVTTVKEIVCDEVRGLTSRNRGQAPKCNTLLEASLQRAIPCSVWVVRPNRPSMNAATYDF